LFSKIILPVDGSKYAEKAVDVAISLGTKYGAEITLLYVVQIPSGVALTSADSASTILSLEQAGKEILTRAEKKFEDAGLEAKRVLEYGNPAAKILELAEKGKHDLVVMGSRGMSEIKAFFLGSVSDKVSHHANCAVLIVR